MTNLEHRPVLADDPESVTGHRPFNWDWARDIRDACAQHGTAFFLKQGGGHRPGDRGWKTSPKTSASANTRASGLRHESPTDGFDQPERNQMSSHSGVEAWEKSFEKRPWWTTLRAALAVTVIVLACIALVGLATTGSVFFQAEAAKRTLAPRITKQNYSTDNVIQKQEMFQQLYADIHGYEQNVAIAAAAYKAQPSSLNLTNLTGARQQCVNTVEQYNAEARKITSRQWRSHTLPFQVNPKGCTR